MSHKQEKYYFNPLTHSSEWHLISPHKIWEGGGGREGGKLILTVYNFQSCYRLSTYTASSWAAMRTYFYVTFWGWGKLDEVFSHIYSFLLTGSKCALCFGYGDYDCITQVCSYIQDFCSRISFRDYTAEFNNTLAAMLHVAQCADETLCKRLHRLYSRNEHVFVMCCSGNMCNRVLACI